MHCRSLQIVLPSGGKAKRQAPKASRTAGITRTLRAVDCVAVTRPVAGTDLEQGAAMQVRVLSAAAAVVVVAMSSAACNPATKSKAAATAATPRTATATSAAATATSAATSAAGTPTPASGGGTVDVCGLMTSAQASSINGVTYGATTPKHLQNGFDTCTYKNNGSADPVDIQDLTVQVISLPGCYSSFQTADGPGTKVPGVGDDAFGYSIGIIVKLGSRCLDVSGLTDAEIQSNYGPDVAMAKLIISKLS
jgi:hypothetical protein